MQEVAHWYPRELYVWWQVPVRPRRELLHGGPHEKECDWRQSKPSVCPEGFSKIESIEKGNEATKLHQFLAIRAQCSSITSTICGQGWFYRREKGLRLLGKRPLLRRGCPERWFWFRASSDAPRLGPQRHLEPRHGHFSTQALEKHELR